MKQASITVNRRIAFGRVSEATKGNIGKCFEAAGFYDCGVRLS